jgi:hypothetical protein
MEPAQEVLMAHQAGERLRCEECGAEILYVRACPCPDDEHKAHPDVCCDRPMTSLGVERVAESPRPEAGA